MNENKIWFRLRMVNWLLKIVNKLMDREIARILKKENAVDV